MSSPSGAQQAAGNSVESSVGPRKFKCDTCKRQFNRREHLQRHETIHFGHKPFHCSICRYSCRRRDLLNRHVKLSHSKKSVNSARRSPVLPNQEQPSTDHITRLMLPQCDSYEPVTQVDQANHTPSGDVLQDAALAQSGPLGRISPYTGIEGSSTAALPEASFFSAQHNTRPIAFSYLDNVSLPPLFDQAAFYPGLSIADPFLSPEFNTDITQSGQLPLDRELPEGPSGTNPNNDTSFSQDHELDRHHINTAPFLRVSQNDWQWLSVQVSSFSSVLPPSVNLPSRHAISRYMHGFMTGFHPHFPILHPQTLHFRNMAPELILALAAVGSQYCLESHQGINLFPVAKAIAMEQLRRRDAEKDDTLYPSQSPSYSLLQSPRSLSRVNQTEDEVPGLEEGDKAPEMVNYQIGTMQALFFLMAMATWGGERRSLVRQAFATQSVLSMLVRQLGLFEPSQPPLVSSWEEWARDESARRTKLIIFSFFNLHTIAFNIPSPLLITDIQLRIPCAELEWKATDAITWGRIHEQSAQPPLFQDVFKALLTHNQSTPSLSSLGGHVVIHALIQRISCVHQAVNLDGSENSIMPDLLLTLKQALRKWQSGWEQNPESSYSPLDKYGPIAFNSRALYHLAHIRLIVDIGSARSLLEQSASDIAKRLFECPKIGKGPQLLLAARHATAALCSPVQMGVHFVGRAPSWSVMHAVCSLEYAYILNQFLETYALPGCALEGEERALVNTLKETLYEVETSLPTGNPKVLETEPKVLGPKAVRAWAMILDGMRTWNAVNLITKALFSYADLLEHEAFQACSTSS